MNFINDSKITRVSNAVAAGTTDVNSSSVDMSLYEAVTFIALFGTITATAVTSVKVQQSDDDSTWNDLTGTSISIADDDDNKGVRVEIERPRERYVRLVIDRGTANAVIDGALAIQHRPKKLPDSDDSSTMVTGEHHLSPAEGTA